MDHLFNILCHDQLRVKGGTKLSHIIRKNIYIIERIASLDKDEVQDIINSLKDKHIPGEVSVG